VIRATSIGSRVRVLNGPTAGRVGVIVDTSNGQISEYKVRFDPALKIPAIGSVKAVWRTAIELEEMQK
jgi:hypothetical protein